MADQTNPTASGMRTSEGKIAAVTTLVSAVLGVLSAFGIGNLSDAVRETIIQTTGMIVTIVPSVYAVARAVVKRDMINNKS